jgi:putative DNA methylase
MTHRQKLIEVALPLEAINEASAREKSIRLGHPSTLHLWWARRPLAAARAVIFASLVDDPDSPGALPAFVQACKQLPRGKNVDANGDTPRMRLFDFIERLVTWEATTDEAILNTARELIQIATEGEPPPLLDPFAGGGSIPLEAQRLGLEAHAGDLNPVAVMINKAQIEIPPRFANKPPVNPRDREKMFGKQSLTPKSPLPQGARGLESTTDEPERIAIPPELHEAMKEIARKLRREQTASEEILWQVLRNRQLDDRKFRRQQPVGAFVLDFYCADERLAVEVDGPIHENQKEADAQRQEILESLGIRFVRLTAAQVEDDLAGALAQIRAAFLPSPLRGRGAGGEGENPSPLRGRGAGGEGESLWKGAAGLATDVRYYGEWMREKAWERIGHLYPPLTLNPSPTRGEDGPLTLNPSPTRGEGLDLTLSPSRTGGEGLQNPDYPSLLRGRGGQGVRGSWDPQQDKRPTVWEATHHLIERLNSHGETGSAMLMTKMPHDMAAEARNLAYRLYSICERKGWAEHARDYNALVISWAGIGEETARLREAAESGQATQQMGLGGEFE